jgi:phosphoribosylformylglycinamidine (FGAM) synthase PurS component
MYYLVKIKFETETDQGKRKFIKELYVISANSVSDAEAKAIARFGEGLSAMTVESVQESKILGIIE